MTWTELGDGVFSWRYRSLDLNVGAVICPTGVLLVDTRATPVQARELRADLSRLTRLPVQWVVNTHHHWDHTFGNAEFSEAAIWGHERCADALTRHGESMRTQVQALAPDHADELAAVVITPPTHTFRSEITVSFGGREVELRHLGRGHTDNDVVVMVPDALVVFAGDLIEESAAPGFADSYPLEWPDTLRFLADLAGGVVVPGHGAAVDAAFVRTQASELQVVADAATQRHRAGMTVAEAVGAGGPYPERNMTDAFTRAWEHLR